MSLTVPYPLFFGSLLSERTEKLQTRVIAAFGIKMYASCFFTSFGLKNVRSHKYLATYARDHSHKVSVTVVRFQLI